MADYYQLLGVSRDADAEEIKKAYRKLARQHHPDLNPGDAEAAEQFKRVAHAFETLSSPERRASFDQSRRPARGVLPEGFVAAVNTALDRAEAYVERMVLPHYTQLWRGRGAVAVALLWQDLEALRDTSFLSDSTPGWWARRRARRLAGTIRLDIDWAPAGDLSMRHRTLDGKWQVLLTPWILHRMGFDDPAALDDAVLRVVLLQYASVLAFDRFRPPGGPRGWAEAMDEAEQTDREHRVASGFRIAGSTLLVGVVLLLVYSGYASW